MAMKTSNLTEVLNVFVFFPHSKFHVPVAVVCVFLADEVLYDD
jgi:hypothetical protein